MSGKDIVPDTGHVFVDQSVKDLADIFDIIAKEFFHDDYQQGKTCFREMGALLSLDAKIMMEEMIKGWSGE